MRPPVRPLAIVGAGVGGLALALALVRRGWPVVVYEQAAEIAPVGAGLNLWQNATHVLRELGVLDVLVPLGARYRTMEILDVDGSVLASTRMPQGEAGTDELPGFFVRRADLHAALLDALPAGVVKTGHRLASFEPGVREGVILHFEKADRVVASALVGADGVRSRVRRQMFAAERGGTPVYRGYHIWQGLVPGVPEGYRDGRLSETWGAGRRFSVFPCGREQTYWFASATRAEGASIPRDSLLDFLRHTFSGWHAPVGDVLDAIDPAAVHAAPILDLAPLPTWHTSHAVLLGDAAHAITPNVGQGACLALEDALVLAKRLVADETFEDAFAAYERARRPRVTTIGRQARLTGWIGQWRAPALVKLRRRLLRAAPARLVERQMAAVAAYRA